MNCPKCGAQMPEESKWCNQCGAKLEETRTPKEPGKVIFETSVKTKGWGAWTLIQMLYVAMILVGIYIACNTYSDITMVFFILVAIVGAAGWVETIIQQRVNMAQTLRVEAGNISGIGMKSKFSTQPFSLEPNQISRVAVKGSWLTIETNIRSGVDMQKIMFSISDAETAAIAIRKVCGMK